MDITSIVRQFKSFGLAQGNGVKVVPPANWDVVVMDHDVVLLVGAGLFVENAKRMADFVRDDTDVITAGSGYGNAL